MRRGKGAAHALMGLLAACGDDSEKTPVTPVERHDECYGLSDRTLCVGTAALTCRSGKAASREVCAAPQSCFRNVGCRVCEPAAPLCEGNTRARCNAEGSAVEQLETCASGLSCSPDGCLDLCAVAAEKRSYLGCDYWPVFTSNSQLDPQFTPAVSIGNGNLVAAHVEIRKGSQLVAELDVPPAAAQTVELAFDDALQRAGGSRLVRQGAYHLTSSVPVTVHQFNPLLFNVPRACTVPRDDAGVPPPSCNSYTNDASLLFPSTALTVDPDSSEGLQFIAASRASFMGRRDARYEGAPGFVAVVAVGDRPATVTLRSTAYTLPSPPDAGAPDDALEALAPESVLQRTLSPGDVLQVLTAVPSVCQGTASRDLEFCDPGPQFDFTGTTISADAPIEVLSGHDCSNVPFDRKACDHLEESLPPLRTWGLSAAVTVPSPAAGGQYVLRVISGADENHITFDPPVRAPVTLKKQEMIEIISSMPTLVKGTGRLMLAQYLVGQQARQRVGDPALTIMVPTAQYRTTYNFVSPDSYERNYVDIVALQSDIVTLDGEPLGGFSPLGQSPYGVKTVVLPVAGAHEIRGNFRIGIQLYGLGAYTSYMLPGGLDLAPLAPIGI